MKNLIIVLALALSIVCVSSAQYMPSSTVTVTDTLGAAGAYSPGQRVCGGTTKLTPLVTAVPRRDNAVKGAWIHFVSVVTDSICPGTFSLYAVTDTVGYMGAVSANRAAFVDIFGQKCVGSVTVSTGVRGGKCRGETEWSRMINFDEAVANRLYWFAAADSAWTNKAGGVFTFSVTMESE